MGKTLVIADDAPFIREVFRNILQQSEYEVIGEADNGETAVDVVLRRRPDFVIMDIVMPKKSGIQAAKEILSHFPEIKIVACSTIDQDTLISEALKVGCKGYLHKPFNLNSVIDCLQRAQDSE